MAVVPESAAIVNALRSGLVPNVGLEHFATGLDSLVIAVNEDLDFVAAGKGLSKWIRGEYGTGKTFAARYLCTKARERKFASSEVQISVRRNRHHGKAVFRENNPLRCSCEEVRGEAGHLYRPSCIDSRQDSATFQA